MDIINNINTWLYLAFDTVSPYFISFWTFFNDYAYFRVSLIAAASYLIAKFLSSALTKLIKNISQRLRFNLGEEIALLLESPLFYFIFLNGLILVVVFSEFNETPHFVALSVLKSLLIIVLSASLLRIVKLFLQKAADNAESNTLIQPQTLPLFKNTALIFVLTGAIHQIFSVWGVDMTALLASAGIAGLAIGMASKDMLSDVISGILIMTDSPYKINDTVELESGLRGMITNIGIRSTRILTKDNVEIIIPNTMMSNTQITNESSAESQGIRLKLVFSTAAGTDPEHIRTLLINIADHNENVLHEQAKKVQVLEFNERCTTFRLMFWIKEASLRGATMTQLREDIYTQLLQENIPFASPTEREISITSQPTLRQEVAITEFPVNQIEIKEMPNLFGNGKPRTIRKPNLPKSTKRNSSKGDNDLKHTAH